MKNYPLLAIVAGLLISASAPAVILTATDAGFVTEAGGSAKGDGTVTAMAKYNYSVGRELHYGTGALGAPLAVMDRRNYFVFDLSSVTTTITSATLTLWTGITETADPSEGYGLFGSTDVGTALGLSSALAGGALTSEFDTPTDPLVVAAGLLYTKLTDGPFLGGIILLAPADDGKFVDISFTPSGLAYLNSFLGGTVILGGKVPTVVPPASPQQPFGFTGADSFPGSKTPKLTVGTVPEPSTWLSLAAGAFFLAARRRRS